MWGCMPSARGGILQCLYVQQDALESMVRAFEPNAQPLYRIESEPEAEEVRKIRNKATGHPTKEGNVKSKKSPGIQMSHFIVQHSMRKSGFTLMTSFADGNHTFTDVSIPELIQKNRITVERLLKGIMTKLEVAEMEHRTQFRGERLADLFPETLGYYFEKVCAGTDSPTSPDGQYGGIHLKMIAEEVQAFRVALQKRGLLNRYSHYEYYITEVEYPLGELQKYWEGAGSLRDPRAAHIFAFFLRDKIFKLQHMAEELDQEYNEDTGANP
ncbi:MAG: hypothetical protein AAB393_00835, partial [Bacteroidota bacterium]